MVSVNRLDGKLLQRMYQVIETENYFKECIKENRVKLVHILRLLKLMYHVEECILLKDEMSTFYSHFDFTISIIWSDTDCGVNTV